jgi:hypothetical protein
MFVDTKNRKSVARQKNKEQELSTKHNKEN